mmetsp:Transcript_19248/g.58010  ORF Transcript_19248/g.58010 Transcript_19248/m.58010 type:complete len:205 (-) Transcript_19248:1515-2129(-)
MIDLLRHSATNHKADSVVTVIRLHSGVVEEGVLSDGCIRMGPLLVVKEMVKWAMERKGMNVRLDSGEASSLEHVPEAVGPTLQWREDKLALHRPSQRHSVVHEPPLERLQNEVLGWPVAHRENITAALQDVSDEVCRPFNLDHCRGLMSYVGLWPIVKVEECSVEVQESRVFELGRLWLRLRRWTNALVIRVWVHKPHEALTEP